MDIALQATLLQWVKRGTNVVLCRWTRSLWRDPDLHRAHAFLHPGAQGDALAPSTCWIGVAMEHD